MPRHNQQIENVITINFALEGFLKCRANAPVHAAWALRANHELFHRSRNAHYRRQWVPGRPTLRLGLAYWYNKQFIFTDFYMLRYDTNYLRFHFADVWHLNLDLSVYIFYRFSRTK